jgi:hypothetical protein
VTASEGDNLLQTRLDVAEMKGMLSQVVSNHNERLAAHDKELDVHEMRLNEKARTIARHDERIKGLEEDSNARQGKVLGIIGSVVAVFGLVFALYNRLTLGG